MRLPPSKQTVTGSILTPGTFFRGDLHGHEKKKKKKKKKNSTTIVSLPLIQERQLSGNRERMCTKHWLNGWQFFFSESEKSEINGWFRLIF